MKEKIKGLIGLIGNILVSYLVGSVFFFGGLIAGLLERIAILVRLSFLVCLAREIQKDIEDFQGDRLERKTIVFRIGRRSSLLSAALLLVVACFFSALPWIEGLFGWKYTTVVAADSLFILLAVIGFRNIFLTQRITKAGMLFGIGSFILGGIT